MDKDTGAVDITLAKPLEVSGTKTTSLRMREPTVGDQLVAEEAGGSQAQQEVTLFANLCGIAPTDLKRMPMRDYVKLQVAYQGFTS